MWLHLDGPHGVGWSQRVLGIQAGPCPVGSMTRNSGCSHRELPRGGGGVCKGLAMLGLTLEAWRSAE